MAGVPTLANLKTYLGITTGDAEHEAVLTSLLAAAVETVRRETGLVFDRETPQTRYFSGGRRGAVALVFGQPVTVSEVSLQDASILGTGFTALVSTEWELRGSRLLRSGLAVGSIWPYGEQNIRVTYTAGYDEDAHPMPDDLRQAILEVAATAYRNRRTERPVVVGDAGAFEVVSRLPPSARATIRSYQLPAGF